MSFISTFNSLSTNGWKSINSQTFIYEVSETISPAQSSGTELSRSIAISYAGNIIIAGAPLYDKTIGNVTYTDAGAVVIYSGSDATWTQNQILTGSNVANGDTQGYAVSISGDGNYVALSSSNGYLPNLNAEGSVYVFSSNGTSYNQQTQLLSSGAANNGNFGSAISLSKYGNYMCVGASNEKVSTVSTGAAYIFARVSTTWNQQQRLTPSDTGNIISFGSSCAIDSTGTYAIVGATTYNGSNTHSGAAYIYGRSGNTWTQLQRLTPSSPVIDNQFFGQQVQISENGNTIAVSGPSDGTDYINGGGSVWIYSKSGNTWSESQRINCIDPINHPPFSAGQFGYGLSLDAPGNWLMISDIAKPITYAYYLQGGTFNLIQSLNYFSTTGNDYAQQIACSNNATYLVVNEPAATVTYADQGLFEIYKNTTQA